MIHSCTVIYGHCLTLKELFEKITGISVDAKSMNDLQKWYDEWCDQDLQRTGFVTGQFSDQQCDDAGIPRASVALGYKVADLPRFTPVFLHNLFSDPNPKPKFEACVGKITNSRILEIIQFVEPQMMLVVDEDQ